MKIDELANSINGKIFGNDDFFSGQDFTGRFTLLNDGLMEKVLKSLLIKILHA